MPYPRAAIKEKFRPKSLRLMDQVREVLRYHHYAIRTEEAYVRWILQFIRFNNKRHPKEMGKAEIEQFLSHLAMDRKVVASTQNQAMNAVLFLYKQVLAQNSHRVEYGLSFRGEKLLVETKIKRGIDILVTNPH